LQCQSDVAETKKTKDMKTQINWNEYRFVNVSDLPDEVVEKIISENIEYLLWTDGTSISKEELQSDFVLLKMEDGTYSLTMKDEDFYINDICFS
jgi:hypothetical protein